MNNVLLLFLDLIRQSKSNENLLEELKKENLLYQNFEERYIVNNSEKDLKIIDSFEKKTDEWVINIEGADGSPFRIEIVNSSDWKIKSFKFQCQGCFGENPECDVCGGEGWGVL